MLNIVSIQGRMGGDPSIFAYGEDKEKAVFSVACQRDGKEATTDWIPCVAWGWTAAMLKRWFRKGDSIILYGRLETYKDKEGKDKMNVVADRVYFPGSRKDKYDETLPDEGSEIVYADEDLPF